MNTKPIETTLINDDLLYSDPRAYLLQQGLRGAILLAAFERFVMHGVKATSMTEVSNAVGISKRTLYELYKDKETLLLEGLEFRSKRIIKVMEVAEQRSDNALEVILFFVEEMKREFVTLSERFITDVRRYPIVTKQFEVNQHRNNRRANLLYRRGIAEGLFLDGIKINLVTHVMDSLIMAVHEYSDTGGFTTFAQIENILYIILRGISTSKGQSIIEAHIAARK